MYRKHRLLSALAAALLLGACAENEPLGVEDQAETRPVAAGPQLATVPVGPRWHIFTSQTPDQTLTFTTPWEVGTRFRTSKPGRVVGFRFWRASGETGTNYARLWAPGGQRIGSPRPFPNSGAGWSTLYLSYPVRIQPNTNYRVSVNTNSAQVKLGGGYAFVGPISNGPLYSDAGYYGQPAGSMPATQSTSYFFVDVIFEEDPPMPNLYIGSISLVGDQVVTKVCNNGPVLAGESTTRFSHKVVSYSGGIWNDVSVDTIATPAIGAGSCWEKTLPANVQPQGENLWDAFADWSDDLYEANEGDNYDSVTNY